MAFIAVTYSFTNATTSDATQVNQNFTDMINGLSDGTKDISVNAGTFAGNVSISGNTTIGNASGDDLTITASLASSIPIKTTNTYDIGTSTIGLRALYFGANSQTVNIKGSASMSATWTFTLPVSAGTSGYFLKTDGAGVSSWTNIFTNYVSKSGNYTLVASTDDVVIFTAVATATLPTAASITGKKFTIINSAGAYIVTVATTSSQTIGGHASSAIKLYAKGDYVTVMSDGSNWLLIDDKMTVAFKYFRGSNQSINNTTNTTVNFDTISFATHSASISSGVFTAPISGAYSFHTSIRFASNTTGERLIGFKKNGVTLYYATGIYSPPTGSPRMNTTETFSLAASDTIEVQVYQASGGALNVEPFSETFFGGFRSGNYIG